MSLRSGGGGGTHEPERRLFAHRTEGAVGGIDLAERLLPQPGPGRGLDYQAGLVAVLGGSRPGDHLHVLKRVLRHLGGECLALLIADGLPVHHVAGLRVVALRMEEAVGIGHHAREC